jgi:long-chain acyl-CoA synthetase
VRYSNFLPTRTLPQQLDARADAEPDEVALAQWSGGQALPVTWREYRRCVAEIALGLKRHGVTAGDRVAIMSDARREWPFAALAAQTLGALALGVYPTNSPHEIRAVLDHSGAVAVVGETEEHLAKIAAVAPDLPALRLVIGIDASPPDLPGDVVTTTLDALAAEGSREGATPERFAELIRDASIDDAAVLFYTSGSTGTPKGVTHSHRSLQHAAQSVWGYYPDIDRTRHDLVGFLPVAHVAPNIICIMTPLITRMVVTYCKMAEFEEVLRHVRPTAVLWPPRFYEKLAARALAEIERWSAPRRTAYRAAMAVGRRMAHARWARRRPAVALRVAYAAALKLVFVPLRATVGLDRMQVAWTASAPMPPSVMALWQIWGLDLRETYGLTETGGSVTGHFEMPFPPPGDIGVCFEDPRWQIKRAEDGELLLRAPLLFTEYWRNPEATAEAMDDGWFRTGDLVELLEDGRVRLVGRKKDVIITSGGKTISPQPLEVSLKQSPLISEAVVVGDGRKYLTVLVEPDGEGPARELGDGELKEGIAAEIERVNRDLARAQQIKMFRILPRALAIETGERTANGKMKREGVVASFAELIDEMYERSEADAIAGQVDGRR